MHGKAERLSLPVKLGRPQTNEHIDHTAVFTPYFASDDSETLDGITRNLDPDFKRTYPLRVGCTKC